MLPELDDISGVPVPTMYNTDAGVNFAQSCSETLAGVTEVWSVAFGVAVVTIAASASIEFT